MVYNYNQHISYSNLPSLVQDHSDLDSTNEFKNVHSKLSYNPYEKMEQSLISGWL